MYQVTKKMCVLGGNKGGNERLSEVLLTSKDWHGEGNGTPLPYFCLENPMDGGAWQAAVHGVANSRIRLSDFTFTFQT